MSMHADHEHQINEALRASEARYRHLVETSHDLIWAVDAEDRITYLNPAARAIYGRDPAEMIGRSFRDFVVPGQTEKDMAFAEAMRTGHETVEYENQVYRADGSIITLQASARILRDVEGRVVETTGISRDVTLHKRVEEALRNSTERFELVGRATNDAVWDWDLVTQAVWWSENFQTLFGYAAAEIGADVNSWTSRLHPDDLARVHEGVYGVINGGGKRWEGEYRFRRRDGTYAYIFDRGHVQHDSRGTPVRMIGAMMDVSARKEAEERFRQLAQHINEVFWLTDVAKLQMLYVSPGYETIFGRAFQSVYDSPRSWLEAVHPEDRERITHATFEKQMAGTYDEEYRILRPDGELRWIREKAFPIEDSAGKVYRLAGIAADITQQKQLEEDLRHSQKMEAVGQLSGGVAHDFNNILTVIQGNAALLESGSFTPEEITEYAQEIINAAERGSGLTRQLLMFSRKQIVRPVELDLSEVADNLTKMLQRIVGEHIVLRTEYAAKLPCIRADAGMIEQILLNLVVNSRDAMPDGGELTICTAVVSPGSAKSAATATLAPAPFVWLSVRDTGSGIEPHILPRIFEPFFTTKEAGKGTGLGLATVYGIVKQHHGSIKVASNPGAGTTFDIFFPATTGTPEQKIDELPTQHRGGLHTHTILVVEDEPAVRVLVANQLERQGYTVLQAESGVAALEVWKQNRDSIDLLLTDLIMPGGVNGRELGIRLQADKPGLRVIYSSGYTADLLGQGEELVEGVNFIQKPYPPKTLFTAINNELARA